MGPEANAGQSDYVYVSDPIPHILPIPFFAKTLIRGFSLILFRRTQIDLWSAYMVVASQFVIAICECIGYWVVSHESPSLAMSEANAGQDAIMYTFLIHISLQTLICGFSLTLLFAVRPHIVRIWLSP